MFKPWMIVSLFIAALCAPQGVRAQGTDDQRSACTGDAFRLCSAQIPDATNIEKCLEANLPNLTPACRAQFDDPAPPVAPPKARKRTSL